MTDQDEKRQMFGKYRLQPNSGVNPPYAPAYPVEWGCTLRTVENITRVQPGKIESLLADTPFQIASDRVAFRFMLSPDPMGICAGREVFGYTKKDAHYAFDEHPDGSIEGWVKRRGFRLADFSFTPDPAA